MKKILNSCLVLFIFSACTKTTISNQFDVQRVDTWQIENASSMPDSTLLKGKTASQKLDSAGKWHNDYQTALLSQMIAAKINLVDTATLHPFIDPRTNTFFVPKGITPTYYPTNFHVGREDTLLQIDYSFYSAKGGNLLTRLNFLLNVYANNPTQAFYDSLSVLRAEALALPSNNEKMTVGIPIAIAKSSSEFWSFYGTTYANGLWANMKDVPNRPPIIITFNPTPPTKTFKFNKGSMIKADVVGAVAGGRDGFVFAGPEGAVALGILGAAGTSLWDIGDQLIGQWTGWW